LGDSTNGLQKFLSSTRKKGGRRVHVSGRHPKNDVIKGLKGEKIVHQLLRKEKESSLWGEEEGTQRANEEHLYHFGGEEEDCRSE